MGTMTKACWFWEQTLTLNGIAEGTKDESRLLPIPSLFGALVYRQLWRWSRFHTKLYSPLSAANSAA